MSVTSPVSTVRQSCALRAVFTTLEYPKVGKSARNGGATYSISGLECVILSFC